MPDPFEPLRAPIIPIQPRAAFKEQLRARLRQGGTVMPEQAPGVVAGLIVRNGRRAIEWYTAALGASPIGDPIYMPDGRVGHAELAIGDGRVYLADEPGTSLPTLRAPGPGEPVPVTLFATVPDVDATVHRAADEGADVERLPADYPYGRNAVIRDPFGHRWLLTTPARAQDLIRPGDLAYVSLNVPDEARAARFFSELLGWRLAGGRHAEGTSPSQGIFGGQPHSTLFVCITVDDIEAARRRVLDAGGQAGSAQAREYGVVADCVDDQGTAFALYQAPPGTSRPAVNGARQGDLSYVTLEVVDSARARAFFGTVAGWRFTPGRVPDGWAIQDAAPMCGLHGGHAQATGVPMYRVDDVHTAVARVRQLGGTASNPEQQPYGWTSECTDDQGTRFYLGQH